MGWLRWAAWFHSYPWALKLHEVLGRTSGSKLLKASGGHLMLLELKTVQGLDRTQRLSLPH